jgi:hypothetical protein
MPGGASTVSRNEAFKALAFNINRDLDEATQDDRRTDRRAESTGAWTGPLPAETTTKASERGSVPCPLSVLLVVVPTLPAVFPDIKFEKQICEYFGF